MNGAKMRFPMILIYRCMLVIGLVVSVGAVTVITARSQAAFNAHHSPDATSASEKGNSHAPQGINTESGAGSLSPEGIELSGRQADSTPDINWAWLALPMVLGMLLITLRRQGGK